MLSRSKQKISVLNGWCEKIGRAPNEIEKTILLSDPEKLSQLDAYHDIGVTHIIVGMGIPFDFAHAEKVLRWRDERNR